MNLCGKFTASPGGADKFFIDPLRKWWPREGGLGSEGVHLGGGTDGSGLWDPR